MIDLYAWTSPNCRKISIMLEECALPYRVILIDLTRGEQQSAEFAAINPNRRVPAIVDADAAGEPLVLAESGAILIYLGELAAKLLPRAGAPRAKTLQWVFFQTSHIGPSLGQAEFFLQRADEKIPYAIQHFMAESLRLLRILNSELANAPYLAGEYSIADIASYPWVEAAWGPLQELAPQETAAFDHLRRWRETLADRPAVRKGMRVPEITTLPP